MSDACKSCSQSGSCSPKDKESCAGPSAAGLKHRLSKIKHKIVVMSGKGGVGKSTVAVNIAVSLALAGKKVGLLDVDVHGPSVPRLLSLKGAVPHVEAEFIEPVPWSKNLWVMSMGFLIPDEAEAVVWRGPVKIGVIRQFMENVAWASSTTWSSTALPAPATSR
jgi:Mrp family chromosome partitioning ATPase